MRVLEATELYVAAKKRQGIGFDKGHSNLVSFSRQVRGSTLQSLTTQQVLKYLDGPRTSTVSWRAKHSLLRHFFEFLECRGYMRPLALPPLRPPERCTFTPYVYSREEIRSLLKAVGTVQASEACAQSEQDLRTLLLVLYGTGALLGEVLRLRWQDLDLDRGFVSFYTSRFDRSRRIPLGPDLLTRLQTHAKLKCPAPNYAALVFATRRGTPPFARTLNFVFQRLRRAAGIHRTDNAIYQPRLHDLRTTFAVHRITAWIKTGADLNRLLPALSTYMGHVSLRAAERYLALTPERFRKSLGLVSPHSGVCRWHADPALMKFLREL